MSDTDGSSNAAQGARDEDEESSKGLLTKWFQAFGNGGERTDVPAAIGVENSGGDAQRSLANLIRLRVEDVMIPKVEIVAAPIETGLDDLYQMFKQSGLTRLPVYRDTLDTPLGLVHMKDFALRHGFNGGKKIKFDLESTLRPLLFAPPSMPIGVLLQKMQNDRIHMALVIDEYGGVDGLVTIEDLIEQVIGEIEDEHDIEEGQLWVEEAVGCYLAQSRMPIDEFERLIGQKLLLDNEDEEIDTLGGLVIMLAGRVPARGEVVKHPDGVDFEVVDADPRRIKRLRVRLSTSQKQAAE